MNKKNDLAVRTRFAPSPTGKLHLGGARTALFNYLLAKKYQGKFILRVEDTDQARSEEEYINKQYQDLLWLGLKPDESPFLVGTYGPYQQTKRLNIYQKYAQALLAQKKAYYCFCSKEELAQEKAGFLVENKRANYQYSRQCLKLSSAQIENFLQIQKPYVLRLKIIQANHYTFQDLVRGEIIFHGKDIEDFVIFRSNGLPLLNFAVVIDDHLMEISHILRGEEHLSNTAKQLVLYEAFGWTPPQFGHLSIIINQARQKLSKRDQATNEFQMIYQLREKGYLPSAIINYLLFLGWHPGEGITQEIFNLQEATKNFNLNNLHSRGAVFTLEKLNWYNNYYIQQLDQKEFSERAWNTIQKEYQLSEEKKKWVEQITLLFRPQLNYFQELINLISYFLQKPHININEIKENEVLWLAKLSQELNKMDKWETENIKLVLKTTCLTSQIPKKDFYLLVRKVLTGKSRGPELPQIIFLLGKAEVSERLIPCY